jgi:hypothetical protein
VVTQEAEERASRDRASRDAPGHPQPKKAPTTFAEREARKIRKERLI